jgi:hypothetical protein
MASKKIKAKDQGNIMMMFSKKKEAVSEEKKIDTILTSTNPDVAAFYKTLNPAERIAHELAVEKLGTSYDVTRTHGFTSWLKK